MATEIRLPATSPSMTEGTLARWLKKEGDTVSAGEVIAEIETDKALVDLEAETGGVLGRVYVADGAAAVPVDTVIAVIVQPGETVPAARPAAAMPLEPRVLAVAAGGAAGGDATGTLIQAGGRVKASPLARRVARMHDLNLTLLKGSGPRGRVVKRDVEVALGANASVPPAALTTAPAVVPSAYEEIPHSAMRRVIAQRLSESKQQIPHFYLTVDCQIDELLALRRQINASLPAVKISVNDFVVKAVAGAMRQVPAVNASWTESAVRRYSEVDISVAVATPNGLITPVVHRAETKSLGSISAEIKELADRARHGKLLPHEYQGGGFTISNLGMHGIREFAAIINPPQACNLAVGEGEVRPVVKDGVVTSATLMTCTLSIDHRVVDGAVGAEFLSVFKRNIENPLGLLV
ncbi:2-oxo acid dehydrogenase subunit E2 [Aromatoleum toluclasticum]|uniref:2-oxo acid dehydrogenase subunit E2 n=1 Tax=Aromatoleum toluclasticum TaxID=92003 RepID=UPI001D190AF8|nr:2-oxo acid dehydrogenase subunit E2 [Aromatoleum toluclasticum]MCC4118459.1 2-oxo acid dehydrogenase subunit E2 [Aromatoleum toluclasticum]